MRLWKAVPGMLMAAALGAYAAPSVVRDWGLHREWRMERDPAHPERPARLVEIPWDSAAADLNHPEPRRAAAVPQPPAVRAGMHVTVIRHGATAEICLRGTALGTARTGERVAVRAGLGNAVVHGVVRGPGLVELASGDGR